ncbi:phospholipid phosphatase-related protein type 1 isoform X6 [Polypterus senegalus]|uniref:phospholipid phosphatase-related protein type 1 isoform X6 n=1 Tax=Polypterus senegalus TaxID=55291 RepID=UPI001965D7F9|nr:phospholipid phosphatase-related protein type 1 isoform X6 [Polypterus senegalus]
MASDNTQRSYSIIPCFIFVEIFTGEISMYFIRSTREALIAQEKTIVTGECCYLNPLIRRIIRFIGVFAFGLFATDIFVNAGQVVTGNLAPYFLSVCKPNYTGTECRFNHQFISNGRICTGDHVVVDKARRSFPSKDASLSVYSAVYVTMYITSTIKTKSSRLAKPVLCLGTLCAAFLTGLNRVSEYRNHCSDVVAGFILGSAVALFLGICVVHNFKGVNGTPTKQKSEDYRGLPLMTFPRVESPLETLSAQVAPDANPTSTDWHDNRCIQGTLQRLGYELRTSNVSNVCKDSRSGDFVFISYPKDGAKRATFKETCT